MQHNVLTHFVPKTFGTPDYGFALVIDSLPGYMFDLI